MSLEDSAKRMVEFVKFMREGYWGEEQYLRNCELRDQMPSDFAEIVREARRFVELFASGELMDGWGTAQAKRFMNMTAPIVGEEGQG